MNNDTIASLVVIVFMILVVVGLTKCQDEEKGGSAHHRFRIEYAGYHNITEWDYTDSITHNGNCIHYIDHNWHDRERCGTFEIIKLR